MPKTTRKPTPKTSPPLPMPELLWHATTSPDVVKLPERIVVSIDGEGAPEGETFQQAVGAIYGVAYTLKFARKHEGKDFKIGPLEARWWASTASSSRPAPRASWRWQLRLAVPEDVTEAEVAHVVADAMKKKRGKLRDNPLAPRVRIERLAVQRVGRALHVGPYGIEGKTLDAIDTKLAAARLAPGRSHIEVYLKDPRRTKPAKLETILLRELA